MGLETIHQAQTFTLANGELSLALRPDLGGRIDQITDLKMGRDWIWHPSHYLPGGMRSLPVGACFDDHWSGGWDEVFPNDVAGPFQGRDLVDHGELWSQPWEIVDSSPLGLTLGYQCQTVPVRVEKKIQLDAHSPQATMSYRFHNQSADRIPFLFKHHAAIAIEPGDEILLPDCWVEPAFLEFSKIIGQPGKTRFPRAYGPQGDVVDLRLIPPPESQLQEFYYSSGLSRGYCGLRHRRSQSALIMTFDPADFPYVWMFQSYGGWQGHYVVVVEPCTTLPSDLDTACREQTVAWLPPHGTDQRQLTFTLQRDEGLMSLP
jgi:galactose mutarotase-like enzyme